MYIGICKCLWGYIHTYIYMYTATNRGDGEGRHPKPLSHKNLPP